eukprot:10535954-Lingulodinium_polyedra.AAC.1
MIKTAANYNDASSPKTPFGLRATTAVFRSERKWARLVRPVGKLNPTHGPADDTNPQCTDREINNRLQRGPAPNAVP